MKLTRLQKHRMEESHRHAASVLRDIKQTPRNGAELEYLKKLKAIVHEMSLLAYCCEVEK
jgi:hypothetical protein